MPFSSSLSLIMRMWSTLRLRARYPSTMPPPGCTQHSAPLYMSPMAVHHITSAVHHITSAVHHITSAWQSIISPLHHITSAVRTSDSDSMSERSNSETESSGQSGSASDSEGDRDAAETRHQKPEKRVRQSPVQREGGAPGRYNVDAALNRPDVNPNRHSHHQA